MTIKINYSIFPHIYFWRISNLLKYFRNPVERAKAIFFLSVLILIYTQVKIDYKPYSKFNEPVLADSVLIKGIIEIHHAGFSVYDEEIFTPLNSDSLQIKEK